MNAPAGLDRIERDEWLACSLSFAYWCNRWAQVYDASFRTWLPFHLWPQQEAVAETLQTSRRVVMLKARQLGMSWLTVAYGLWLMLFRPAATVLLFSRRDEEAVHLLAFRLREMYERLPAHQRAQGVAVDNTHHFALTTGSAALAFPTTGGRSYTGTLAVVDEADHCDLHTLLDAVKPTVDAGGQLVLLSTVDKRNPASAFKRIYLAAKGGGGAASAEGYTPVFLPWSARPDRTPRWYAQVKADILARSGSLDALYAEYPAHDAEALAALTSDARFAPEWLAAADAVAGARPDGSRPPQRGATCQVSREAIPTLPNLVVYDGPRAGGMYLIGADPAEGNPQSDESAACVIDAVTGDQVAVWAGRFEPEVFAAGLHALAEWYRSPTDEPAGRCWVGLLVERNNHGHAVLLALKAAGATGVLHGLDGRPGWLMQLKGKHLAVDAAANLLADGCATGCPPRIRDAETLRQLSTFSGSSLAAPAGDHDDRCIAWCLAVVGAKQCRLGGGQHAILPPAWRVDPRETGGW